ncbi:MAG: DEAD/DEAH box helicase family protein, partial [Desulfuromusa sp.]|nr:DEAD/DEAH box helicase family protein [Desulfuromusa sp.]
MPELIADITVNVPLKQLFSYRVPELLVDSVQVGMRVKIPFGRRTTVGFLLALRQGETEGLKDLQELLDDEPMLTPELIKLLRWAADYYCHPIGQVVRTALPAGLGGDKATTKILTEAFYAPLNQDIQLQGKKQQELLQFIIQQGTAGLAQIREQFPAPYAALQRLVDVGALEVGEQEILRDPFRLEKIPEDKNLTLNDAQNSAIEAITQSIKQHCFAGFLLHGVTGSGKTEVYLQAVNQCLLDGR